ncbi:hypothetical protein VE03_10231 [Pseudogymnoascus sp. 23342-1-I1]|nr:hypothetical protein VE03_10231 [Pseudogymnoascus sp. 23342-1-I1]
MAGDGARLVLDEGEGGSGKLIQRGVAEDPQGKAKPALEYSEDPQASQLWESARSILEKGNSGSTMQQEGEGRQRILQERRIRL